MSDRAKGVQGRCGVKRCRRLATEAWDVRNAWRVAGRSRLIPETHYEVCDEHSAEYFRAGFVDAKRSERIKANISACAPGPGPGVS